MATNTDYRTDELGRLPVPRSLQACDRAMVTHSTELEGFTPAQIVQAARADMRRRQRNEKLRADRKEAKRKFGAEHARLHFGQAERYAFAAVHVMSAAGVRSLIEQAIAAPHIGVQTDDPATMRLYRSVGALREALELASDAPEPPPVEPKDSDLPIAPPSSAAL